MILTFEQAKRVTLKHKVIIVPTDTVYGLACLYDDVEAVERIYAVKRRERDKPMAILVPSFKDASPLVKHPEKLRPYANEYWPGAVTFVTEKSDRVPDEVTSGRKTVGIRMPAQPGLLAFMQEKGPLVATSLNYSDEPPIHGFDEAKKFADKVDFMIDGGRLSPLASTVYDIDTHKTYRFGTTAVRRM